MNEIAKVEHIFKAVDAAKNQFEIIVEKNPSVDWASESMFAYQAVSANSYIMGIAQKNRESVKNAVINIAAVGLTLNPATHYAYLVPRGGQICLDISYRGLIKIATDSGSIRWCKAELVYSADEFAYKGPSEKPEHHSNPFSTDRGDVVGAYCIAKTHDDDFLIETMTIAELMKIRDEASAAASKGPWKTYFGEMCKKCVIKRAQKTWPMSDQHERIQAAVNVINEAEGSSWAETPHRFKPGEKVEIIEGIRTALASGDDLAIAQIVDEYTSTDADDLEESQKFWALFNSSERNSIRRMLDDSMVERDRLGMGRPDLTEDVQEAGL